MQPVFFLQVEHEKEQNRQENNWDEANFVRNYTEGQTTAP